MRVCLRASLISIPFGRTLAQRRSIGLTFSMPDVTHVWGDAQHVRAVERKQDRFNAPRRKRQGWPTRHCYQMFTTRSKLVFMDVAKYPLQIDSSIGCAMQPRPRLRIDDPN